MDLIKLKITEPIIIQSDIKEYDIEVMLNDKKLPHDIFNAVQVVAASSFNKVEFDLFTCNCGVAGCAGFHEYVKHNKENDTVTWTFPEANYYKTEKKLYQFDKAQFEQEFMALKTVMLTLETQGIHHVTTLSDESRYVGSEEIENAISVNEPLQESFDWWNSRFTAENEFNDLLVEKFPVEVKQEFFWLYEGKKSDFSYDFGSLVTRALNEYPTHAADENYLDKVKSTGIVLQELISGNNSPFKELVNECYMESGLTSYHILDHHFKIEEESFNIENLKLITG